MIKNLHDNFFDFFHKEPSSYYFSPGRINVIGEHIDYNGGKVLPFAISLGIYGVVKENGTNTVNVVSDIFDGVYSFSINQYIKDNNYLDYIKGVFYIFNKKGYKVKEGFDLFLYSNLPASSGLSSSAALELLISHILNDINDFGLTDFDLVLFSQTCEKEFVGVNCGIMDQFAIGMSKKDNLILLDTETIEYQYIPIHLNEATFIIFNTNKPRNLNESKYNKRRSECEEALQILNKHFNNKRINLCMYTINELDECENILGDVLYRRSKHVISENNRVNKAIEAIKNDDFKMLGKLLYESHESLMNDYEVTGVHLDTIYRALTKCSGVYGGRMCGAGFGGCAIALVEKTKVNDIIKEVSSLYYNEVKIKLGCYQVVSSNRTAKIN